MKKCKFDTTRKCTYPEEHCQHCDVRREVKQKMLVPEPPTVKVEIRDETLTSKLTCPFCLYTDYISKFYIKLKQGRVSEKRFKCPDCGTTMKRDTLTKPMTVEEFAEWIYTLNLWKRIDFSTFKRRLKEMGISHAFWTAYKKAKEENPRESYEEHMAEKQREWAVEQGYIE